MHHGHKLATIAASLLLCGCLLAAGTPAAAQATVPGACNVRQAHQRVHDAERAVARAQARLSEARYVERATRQSSALYGSNVGRWVRLARSEGFPRSTIGDVSLLMFTESRGDLSLIHI